MKNRTYKVAGPDNRLLDDAESQDWVVHLQRPPQANCKPEQLLKYLARYMTRGPISDRRLIALKEDRVHFWARARDKSRRQVRESLPGVTFVALWSQHILPKGFAKVRSYGGWSNRHVRNYLQRCRELAPRQSVLEVGTIAEPQQDSVIDAFDLTDRTLQCPRCQIAMIPIAFTERPSWRVLFYPESIASRMGYWESG
jgi:hypothetical protein